MADLNDCVSLATPVKLEYCSDQDQDMDSYTGMDPSYSVSLLREVPQQNG